MPPAPQVFETQLKRTKWRTLLLLALAVLLAKGVWFSASAVVPALTIAWGLTDSGRAWLTMSVQIGFVAGAFGSALLNLADRLPSRKFLTISTLLAALRIGISGFFPRRHLRLRGGYALFPAFDIRRDIIIEWHTKSLGYPHSKIKKNFSTLDISPSSFYLE